LFRVGELVLFVAVAAAVLAWLYGRARRRRPAEQEDRESVFSGETLKHDLRNLLGGILRRRSSAAAPAPGARTRIGRLYADVVDQARRRGVERTPALTPAQFAPELLVLFESRVPLAITEAFTAAAYGSLDPDPATLDRLEHDWRGALQAAPGG
jgi:hypothetical protein